MLRRSRLGVFSFLLVDQPRPPCLSAALEKVAHVGLLEATKQTHLGNKNERLKAKNVHAHQRLCTSYAFVTSENKIIIRDVKQHKRCKAG